eukprot:1063409-Amphidinium_carterae.1
MAQSAMHAAVSAQYPSIGTSALVAQHLSTIGSKPPTSIEPKSVYGSPLQELPISNSDESGSIKLRSLEMSEIPL